MKNNLKNGFSLMETIIVMGILTILGTGISLIDFNSIKNESIQVEAEIIGISLQRARSKSLNNINQAKHGLVILPDNFDGYVLFEGNNYNPENENNVYIKSSYQIELSTSSKKEIVFEQITGNVIDFGDIEIIDSKSGKTLRIETNYEGRINW